MMQTSGSNPSMNKLSSNTVRLIASSQVITSVFSVVKELVENSLDAGAKCIEIKLENYGFNRIEVRDNGSGIDGKDVESMALPHYTSKITSSEDLQQLLTYGFRGEALGALCAVADVAITTKTADDVAGTQYSVNKKGEICDRKPSHLGTGTTVTAVNLFKNLPVRKQYYSTAKKCREELKRVEDLVTAFSIIRHDVRFWLRHNKDMVYQSTAVSSSRDVLLKVIGTTAMSFMDRRLRDWLDPELRIEMYLPKKSSKWQLMSRTNKDRFYFFVNKRPVEMKTLEKEVKTYYNKVMGCENRWPLGFISLHLSPEDVDVNLEPNKNRVLLQSQGNVIGRLMEMLADLYGPIETVTSPSKTKPSSDDSMDSNNSNMSDSSLLGCGLPHPGRTNQREHLNPLTKTFDIHSNVTNSLNANLESEVSKSSSVCTTSNVSATDLPGVSMVLHSAMEVDKESHSNNSKTMDSYLPNTGDCVVKAGPSEENVSLPSLENILNFKIMDDDFLSSTPILADSDILSADVSNVPKTAESVISLGEQSPTEPVCAQTVAKIAQNVMFEKKQASHEEKGHIEDNAIKGNDTEDTNNVPKELNSEKTWSKGTCLTDKDGKSLQPVGLLIASSTSSKEPDGNVSNNSSNCSVSLPSLSSSSVCLNSFSSPLVNTTPLAKKKPPSAATPDQPSLFEVMGGSIKKPTTAFIFYSKEVRLRVLKENPGASFQDIAKIIGDKWNKLTSNEKAKYENMMSTDYSRYRDEKRKLSDSLRSDMGSAKKQKVNNVNKEMATFVKKKPVEEEKIRNIYEVKTNFSLAKLKQLYKTGGNVSKLNGRSSKLRLLGQLKTSPVWLGIQDEQLCAFCPVRAQETLIYERLLANHTLPADRLENPIRILPSTFNTKLWLTLLGLSKSDTPRTDCHVYYDDSRLLKNGFSVRQYEKCHDLCVEIVGMFEGMNLYGVSDLQEILQAITDNPSGQLQQCRSNKIKQYLQGEAVRMARQLPQRLSFEETDGVLQEIYKKLPVTTTHCFHKKPFLKSLYDMESLDVTLSQGFTPQESSSSQT